jgi:hypothetical protein
MPCSRSLKRLLDRLTILDLFPFDTTWGPGGETDAVQGGELEVSDLAKNNEGGEYLRLPVFSVDTLGFYTEFSRLETR